MDAVIIRLIDMPEGVPAVTRKDAEGDYNIYINARLSADARAEAFRHEIDHIRKGHFYDETRPVKEIEQEVEEDANTEKDEVRAVAHDLVCG